MCDTSWLDAWGLNRWHQFWPPRGAPLRQWCSNNAKIVSFKSHQRDLAKSAKIHGPIDRMTVKYYGFSFSWVLICVCVSTYWRDSARKVWLDTQFHGVSIIEIYVFGFNGFSGLTTHVFYIYIIGCWHRLLNHKTLVDMDCIDYLTIKSSWTLDTTCLSETQVPANCNIATTRHKLQGMPKDTLIVNLWGYGFKNWVHVALSHI